MAGSVEPSQEVERRSGYLFVRVFFGTFPPLGVLGAAIGVLLVETTARLSWDLVPGVIGVAAVLSAVHAGTELSTYPTQVALSRKGMSLTFAKFSIEAPWEDWTPIGRSRITGGVALRARWGSPKGYLVCPQQALQIHRYPFRPPWTQGQELFERLGPTPAAPPAEEAPGRLPPPRNGGG